MHRLHPVGAGAADRPLPRRRARRLASGARGLPLAGLDDAVLDRVRSLNGIAEDRGQKLAQLALQWALRDPRVTSAVIGASSVAQLDTNLDALDGPPLTESELTEIDKYAVESGINLWA